jgi:hypothetical protein
LKYKEGQFEAMNKIDKLFSSYMAVFRTLMVICVIIMALILVSFLIWEILTKIS